MLRALPPSALRSKTVTRNPRSASSCAAARPAIPPPSTATSGRRSEDPRRTEPAAGVLRTAKAVPAAAVRHSAWRRVRPSVDQGSIGSEPYRHDGDAAVDGALCEPAHISPRRIDALGPANLREPLTGVRDLATGSLREGLRS